MKAVLIACVLCLGLAAATLSPADQMLELVRSISDTLRADESDALKSNAQRKSGCMAQEESLRRYVQQHLPLRVFHKQTIAALNAQQPNRLLGACIPYRMAPSVASFSRCCGRRYVSLKTNCFDPRDRPTLNSVSLVVLRTVGRCGIARRP